MSTRTEEISQRRRYRDELIAVFQKASRDCGLLDQFLEDVLTPKEYQELAKRLQIVKLLRQGKTQRYIENKLHVGIATVTRGSRALMNPGGGFNRMLGGSNKNLQHG